MILLEDVVSTRHESTEFLNPKTGKMERRSGPKVYARKGEDVKLISDCGEALILENAKGERFPAKRRVFFYS